MIEDHLQSRRLKEHRDSRITITLVPDYDIGPLRTALTAVETFMDERFLIAPVDAIISAHVYSDILNCHSASSATMMLAVDFSQKSGTQVYVNSDGMIMGIGNARIKGNLSVGRSAMVLVTSREIAEYCRLALLNGETHLVPVLNKMINDGIELACYDVHEEWSDVDTLPDMLLANRRLLKSMDIQDSDIGVLVPNSDSMEIGESIIIQSSDIVVEKGTFLQGPVLLSKGCRVEENCRIGPNVSIGAHARVSKNTSLINAIVQDGSLVPANSHIENSVACESQIYQVEL